MPEIPDLPDLVLDWVRVNPFPTVLVTPLLARISQNSGFGNALEKLDVDLETLIRTCCGENVAELLENPGEQERSLTHALLLPDGKAYDLYLTQLPAVSEEVLCCMLLPPTQFHGSLFTELLESVDSLLAVADREGNIIFTNKTFSEALGFAAEKTPVPAHLRDVDDEFGEESYRSRLAKAGENVRVRNRTRLICSDGTLLPVELTTVASPNWGTGNYIITARPLPVNRSEGDSGADLDKDINYPLGGLLGRVEQVATTDVPVLIEGPVGTKKTTVAQRIHQLSVRRDAPFIVVDCQDLPAELIRNELFGYPKGAFTGAYRDRPGRLSAAGEGTVFINGIERLTLPLQQRLFQLLDQGTVLMTQPPGEQAIEFRLIAGTTENLRHLVERGKFRSDLYERLSGYPIQLLPLQQRTDDLGKLTRYFIQRFNQKFSKEITGVDDSTLNRLKSYRFPNNDRELEQMIERAFVVNGGGTLPLFIPLEEVLDIPRPVLDVFDGRLTEFLSLEEYQRKYIELVLESTNGKVSGKNGAAEILKVHPQTLFSKMKKLGIRR